MVLTRPQATLAQSAVIERIINMNIWEELITVVRIRDFTLFIIL